MSNATLEPRPSNFSFPTSVVSFLGALCAFAYLPTRLVQEANPEWRLVSWVLALEVIVLTLSLAVGGWPNRVSGRMTGAETWETRKPHTAPPGSRKSETPPGKRREALKSRDNGKRLLGLPISAGDLLFPLCFFLVAVPWPTMIEAPLIQALTLANAEATIEVLSEGGIPAVRHGNAIEVSTGIVGIDEACSGIRSFQATLMIALFFGEIYSLRARRRVVCVLAGFALAFIFNVARTSLLTAVASRRGSAAISSWHDPAGVTILVGCFIALSMIARSARIRKTEAGAPPTKVLKAPQLRTTPESLGPALLLLLWLLFAEAGTELWYRAHERKLAPPVTWTIALPREKPGFRELALSEKVGRLLRYDEGLNASWQERPDLRIQTVFFRWEPGRVGAHIARSHTPEACGNAAGRRLLSQPVMRLVEVNGLRLPFRAFVFSDRAVPLHVFYCLWEDRLPGQSFSPASLTYANRLESVLAGRRQCGQRSLELAVMGSADETEAWALVKTTLEQIVRTTLPQDYAVAGPQVD